MAARAQAAAAVVLVLVCLSHQGLCQLQRGTYTLLIRSSSGSCMAGGGYLTAPGCSGAATVTAQASLLSGAASQLQVWRLESTGSSSWTSIQGVSIRIQNDGRAAAQPACDSLVQVPSCGRAGLAQLSAQPTPWVLEAGPAPGLFYIRAACAVRDPLYLGFHRTDCQGKVPSLFPRSGPSSAFADLLWAVEPATQEVGEVGAAQIDSAAVVFPNTVRVLVRPVAGQGIVYRVQGTPLTPNAAVLDVTGAGQLVGSQLLFTFVGTATLGASYDFTVQARSSLQPGPTSAPVRLSIPQRPGPPQNLQVSSIVGTGNTSVILADFLPPTNNGGAAVEAFRVIGQTKGKPDIVQSGQPTVLSNGRLQMRLTSYAPLRQYSFRAAARNPAGWSDSSNPVIFLAPFSGVCQPEAEPCTDRSSCCTTAPSLFCQKGSLSQQLGTCTKCVAPNQFGCSTLNACCQDRKCELRNSTDSMGQCRTCISETRLGCGTRDDCCDSLPCERNRTSAVMGTCQQCVALNRHGCSQSGDCCNSRLCQKDAEDSSAGLCRTCIAVAKHGCQQKADCCGGSSCAKDDGSALVGYCATCIPSNAYGCETTAECCTPEQQCIDGQCRCAAETEPCSQTPSCCGSPGLLCQRTDAQDLAGTCETCVGDGSYGCTKDAHCCTAGYMCNRGFCQCSQKGGKCLSDASCCGGPDGAAFCQRNSPTDAYGTCQTCIASSKFGCSDGTCCSDLMCLPGGAGKTCRCAAANGACISHDSCCKGATPVYCERNLESSAQGACKNCIAQGRYGCSATSNCCGSNKCQQPDPFADGTCQQCIALLSFGCNLAADCCNRNVCQRDAGDDPIGSCQTCIALTKSGCATSRNCCGTNQCQKEALTSAVGTCETCVELDLFGCTRSSHCCDGKCELQASNSTAGQCKECIADTLYGCASSADCCGSSKCQKARASDPLGVCQPCVQDNTFGCAGTTSDDCCSDLMCRPSQGARTCTCAPQSAPCVSDGSCCNSLVCVRDSPPPVPVPAGNFGICSSCIPDSKFGCLSKANCCTASRHCQRTAEDAKAGTCETCIRSDSFGCSAPSDCCTGTDKCQKRNSTDTTGSCRSCVAQNLFGCKTSADCCGGANCQKERSTDQFGTCLPCVNDNKFGCTGSNSAGCCSDFMCQLSTNGARACLCSPLDATCLTKNSCCSGRLCQRGSSSDALGACKTCIAQAQSGCASASDCCTKTNLCQKENRLATTLGSCRTCVDDDKLGCTKDSDCCGPNTPCNGGRCGCSRQGEICSSATSCCQDGPAPMYCQKDGYLSPFGTCQPCVANAKYGCSPLATDSCCDSSGTYSCSHGLGDRTYACRKTLQAPCGLEDSPCQSEADCCEGDPDLDLPPLYCARTQPLGRGTCKQCVVNKSHGCDTMDELSCCAAGGKPEKCADNGKGGGTCLVA